MTIFLLILLALALLIGGRCIFWYERQLGDWKEAFDRVERRLRTANERIEQQADIAMRLEKEHARNAGLTAQINSALASKSETEERIRLCSAALTNEVNAHTETQAAFDQYRASVRAKAKEMLDV